MNNLETLSKNRFEITAYALVGVGLFLILTLHLLPALIAGLLVYELIHVLALQVQSRKLIGQRAKLFVVALLAALIVLLLAGVTWGLLSFFRSEAGSIPALLRKMAEILDGSREKLPAWLTAWLPEDVEGTSKGLVHWLRAHAGELQVLGKEAGRIVAHILIGMVIGILVSLSEVTQPKEFRPLSKALVERVERLGQAFRAVAFAQVRIAGLNALFAWLYLEVALPLFGIHLPLAKTMIAVTFVTGLLPVIGNLISNTIIIVVSLSHSPATAGASLAFLVVIHKLEYFLNARIVGTQIRAQAWEVLLAMLVMEAAFGLAGVVATPIYYAYIKRDLTDLGLV